MSALAGWNRLRFEVTEEASPGCDAVRYSYTPALGTFSAVTGASGDIMIPENRLLAAMTWPPRPSPASRWPPRTTLEEELARLLGRPWDDGTRAVPVRGRGRAGALAARHRLSRGQPPGSLAGPAGPRLRWPEAGDPTGNHPPTSRPRSCGSGGFLGRGSRGSGHSARGGRVKIKVPILVEGPSDLAA